MFRRGRSVAAMATGRFTNFSICLCGACTVKLDDGIDRDEVVLDTPALGLYVGTLMWSTQHRFTPDAVLFVLASAFYRPDEYLRDYAEFLALIAQSR